MIHKLPIQLSELEQEAVQVNQAHWEKVTNDEHVSSDYYPIGAVKNGELSISSIEATELGNIKHKEGCHLQCGIGLDTISLSRLGAIMTGIDNSSNAIAHASKFASSCGLDIQFLNLSIYKLGGDELTGKYDFVYTSHGVLRWLPNLIGWANAIFNLLKPGGFFYIFEIHPMVYRIDDLSSDGVKITGDYFDIAPKFRTLNRNHARPFNEKFETKAVHTDWTLSAIINALIQAGLQIASFNEIDGCSYNRLELFPALRDHLWYPVKEGFPMALSFSIKAIKPA